MKVFYESKLAKIVTFIANFATIMLFGAVFTEKKFLTERQLAHEEVHCWQYRDCFALGLAIDIVAMFVFFLFNICNWQLLWLLLIPVFLFYFIYLLEYAIWLIKYRDFDLAYQVVGFEKQARRIASTYDKPCEKRCSYYSFGWWF